MKIEESKPQFTGPEVIPKTTATKRAARSASARSSGRGVKEPIRKKEQPVQRRNDEQKRFIVELLACFATPTEVVRAVKERFGVDINVQSVEAYNPTRRTGERLSEEWRQLFEKTRADYLCHAENIGLAHRTFRLDVMASVLEVSRARGNHAMTLKVLEQAAKEMGGVYTNRREVSGPDGGAIEVQEKHAFTLESTKDWTPQELDIAERMLLEMHGDDDETAG